jgi:hypothetical protein
MSLEVGESEKCYRFLDGGVHCLHGPIAALRDRLNSQSIAAFRDGALSARSCRSQFQSIRLGLRGVADDLFRISSPQYLSVHHPKPVPTHKKI